MDLSYAKGLLQKNGLTGEPVEIRDDEAYTIVTYENHAGVYTKAFSKQTGELLININLKEDV